MRAFLTALLLSLVWHSGVAMAADTGDCPPIGHLPGYHPEDRKLRDYDQHSFKVQKEDGSEDDVEVDGRLCQQSYTHQGDQEPMSDLEIQSNFREQIEKLGGQITGKNDQNTWAKIVKGTAQTWVQVYSQETEIDVTVVEKKALAQTLLPPGGDDYRLIGHMPGYSSQNPEKRSYAKMDFTINDGEGGSRDVTVNGATYKVTYTADDGARKSDLEIQGNYRAALTELGAEILWTDDRNTVARLQNNGQMIWIKVYSQESEIDISAIEEKPFTSSIQNPTESEMKTALNKDGHFALHLNFDFNKATLKSDAAPVIAQVVTLLKEDPALKISVEGHTDNIGTHDYNVKLSQDRAATVVSAIVQGGIATDRLSSSGAGPDKPVADNGTEEGRAKNRRVEIVKQ